MSNVPAGGLILVTGANGYVASVTVQVLLQHGYHVRGAVRSAAKHQWMLAYFGPKFTLVEITDFNADGAFDKAIQNVNGISHMAMDTQMNPGNVSIVDSTVRATISLLEAAAREPSVNSIVLTSSQAACILPVPGVEYEITPQTYNTLALEELTQTEEGQDPLRQGLLLYAAAKTKQELEAFRWVKEHKPHFSFNSVVPNVNFGTVVAPQHLGFQSSAGFVESVVRGIPLAPLFLGPQWFINVEDTGLLHMAALTIEGINNERIIALAAPFSWGQILEILRRRYPEKKSILKTVDESVFDVGKVENSRAIQLLKQLGKGGFTGLEDTLIKSMDKILEAESLSNVPKSRIDLIVEAQSL